MDLRGMYTDSYKTEETGMGVYEELSTLKVWINTKAFYRWRITPSIKTIIYKTSLKRQRRNENLPI